MSVTAQTWLSVHEASALLGVSPATLRRWSVSGAVEAFRTPGGHRRYALATVQALLGDADPAGAAREASAARLLSAIQHQAHAAAHGAPWVDSLPAEHIEELRVRSRTLAERFVTHLYAAGPAGRERAFHEAEDAARHLGRAARRAGASVCDALGSYLRFRHVTTAAVREDAIARGLSALDATALVTRAGDCLDHLLEVMVTAHTAGERLEA